MIRTLCFGLLRRCEDCKLKKASRSGLSLALVGMWQEIIVVLGLPLNMATIILGSIFSMLLSNFRAHGPIGICILV